MKALTSLKDVALNVVLSAVPQISQVCHHQRSCWTLPTKFYAGASNFSRGRDKGKKYADEVFDVNYQSSLTGVFQPRIRIC